ncbi:MAG: hypothetical protein Q9192_006858, partial [Flavoplaca navasiana]
QIEEYEKELKAALPLIFYAAEFWAHHARIAEEQDGELFQLMIEAFEPGTFEQWTSFVDLSVGNLNIMEVLVQYGANVEVYSDDKHSGLVEVVKFPLDKGPDNDNVPEEILETPLMATAKMNHLKTAQFLISKCADVYAVRYGGRTALVFASSGGYTEMVQILLSNGISTKLNGNIDALRAAAIKGHADIVRILLGAGFDVNATVTAVHEEDLQDGHGWGQSALQHATEYGRLSMVKLLIDLGADINVAADGEWRTALQLASWRGYLEMVQLLVQSGADVGGPYLFTVQFDRITILQTLLKNGADPNIRGGQWGSALQATLELGFGHAAHLLLAADADRDVKLELRSRLEDVDRGINVLFSRD